MQNLGERNCKLLQTVKLWDLTYQVPRVEGFCGSYLRPVLNISIEYFGHMSVHKMYALLPLSVG